jgi:hypothetical protein
MSKHSETPQKRIKNSSTFFFFLCFLFSRCNFKKPSGLLHFVLVLLLQRSFSGQSVRKGQTCTNNRTDRGAQQRYKNAVVVKVQR